MKKNTYIFDDIEIIKDEISNIILDKYDVEPNIELPSLISYYANNIKNRNFSFSDYLEPFYATGSFSPSDSKIVVYPFKCKKNIIKSEHSSFKNISQVDLDKLSIITVLFHEIRHFLQDEFILETDIIDFNVNYLGFFAMGFMYEISDKRHDELYHEIDADLFSFEATLEYLHSKNIFCFDKFLVKEYEQVKYSDYTYDFDKFFNRFCSVINKGFHLYNDKVINKFWNSDGSFKKLDEIYELYNSFSDKSLLVSICTSEAFLKSIDYSLNSDMLYFLGNLIDDYINGLVKSNMLVSKQFEDGFINHKMYNNANKFFHRVKNKKLNLYYDIYDKNRKVR